MALTHYLTRLLLGSIAAWTVTFSAFAAPHPTVLLVRENGVLFPVVNVRGSDPIIIANGKETGISGRSPLYAERAPLYAEGAADLKNVVVNGSALKAVVSDGDNPETSGGLLGGTSYFEASLTTATELRGAFIAIVVFDTAFLQGRTEHSAAQIEVHDVPTVRGGTESKIRFSAPLFGNGSRGSFVPLLFAEGGAEIRTSYSALVAQYFRRVELVRLRRATIDYRTKFLGQDHEPVPFIRVNPMILPGLASPQSDIVATLMIDEGGAVTEVQFLPNETNELNRALANALGRWLFLPKLKAGEPIPSRVVLPFRF